MQVVHAMSVIRGEVEPVVIGGRLDQIVKGGVGLVVEWRDEHVVGRDVDNEA